MNSTTLVGSPKVSIVCAWYNRPEFIDATIESLLNQTYENVEIIIINDGSTDPKVKKKLEKYKNKIKVIDQENTGFTKAISRGVFASSGDFIAIQGAGEISSNSRIEDQVSFLKNNLHIAGVSCQYENIFLSENNHTYKKQLKSFSGIIDAKTLMHKNPILHGATMFQKSIYERVNGYRYEFRYAQDLDLWLRMSLIGNFYILPKQLYTRNIFEQDGVASSPMKAFLQQKYMLAARTFFSQRNSSGSDNLDRFGSDSLMILPRSTTIAKTAVKSAVKLWLKNKNAEAINLVDIAKNEKFLILTLAVKIIFKLAEKYPGQTKKMKTLLRKIYQIN